jgi:hypothetical protein
VRFSTYAGTGIHGELARGSVTIPVVRGENKEIVPVLWSIARNFKLSVQRSSLPRGSVAVDHFTVFAVDAAKASIPSSEIVSASGIKLQHDMYVQTSGLDSNQGGRFRCCGILGKFTYGGLQTGFETIVLTVPGYASRFVTITITPGAKTLEQLITQGRIHESSGSPGALSFIEEFPLSADGDVSPSRSFVLTIRGEATPQTFFGEDGEGDFWSSDAKLSNQGSLVGFQGEPTVIAAAVDRAGNVYDVGDIVNGGDCSMQEFAAGMYGNQPPVRQIDRGTCDPFSGTVAVDGTGNLYYYTPTAPTIAVYAPGTGGSVTPSRTLSFPSPPGANVQLAADAAGNLYALSYPQFLKFTPSATTGQALLPGVPVRSFAVDDDGNIYANVSASSSGPASIEFFATGASTPARIITGPSANLVVGGAIAVPH